MPRSILILKPSSFGDIVHTLPAVARLKAAWPECQFSWLINMEWAPLLRGNPDVDETIMFPRQLFRGSAGPAKFITWCWKFIVGRKPTLALDFQGLLRSAAIGRMSGARSFYGMADAREGSRLLYDGVSPRPIGVVHAVDRYMMLTETVLRLAGVQDAATGKTTLSFPLPEGDAPDIEIGRLKSEFILLHPIARGIGKSLTGRKLKRFVGD